jgi:outer membrane lipoprotein SlyB
VRLSILCACLAGVSAIAGCAPTRTAAPAPGAQAARPPVRGTILSMRTVSPPGDPAPWRAVLLADAGAASPASDGGGNSAKSSAPVVEFIVHTDDGATLSVVQANDAALHPGDRVAILHDAETHLSPAN